MSILITVYLFIGNVKHLASPTFLISFRQHNHKQESLAYQGLIQNRYANYNPCYSNADETNRYT